MNENFVWIILLPFGIFFGILFWVSFLMPRHKTRPNCPDCAQPLSPFQSPFTKTKRMWFEGGYLCSHCGYEVNLDGQKVPAGTAPQQRSVTRGIGMIVIAVVPALILLFIVSQHKPVHPPLQAAPQKLLPAPLKSINALPFREQ